MAFNDLKITTVDINTNNVKSAADTYSADDIQRNKDIFDKLPELIAARVNGLIDRLTEKLAGIYTKEEVVDAINNKIVEMGSGDMAKGVYDTDGDGIVDNADNGICWYTHSKEGTVHNLIGKGQNVKFVATADWEAGDSLQINGVDAYCFNSLGERLEDDELFKINCTVTCVTDGVNTFFKQGGAGLNFKIVGGTVQPASPKENTIWVNTDLEITGWAFDAQQPDNPETGNVWIKTGVNGNAPISAVKGKSLIIYPQSCMQWNGTEFISKDVKVYKNGQWITLKFWFLQGSEQYSGITGGWGAINTTGSFKSATADSSGLVFATTSHIARNIATIAPIDFTGINTLYFSIAACEFSGNAGNGYSMNMGVHTDRTVRWSVDSAQGWAAEKFILKPGAGHIGDWPVDTSSIDAEGYIQIVTHCDADSNLNVTIDEIYGV